MEGDDDANSGVIHRNYSLIVSVEFALIRGKFPVVVVVFNAEDVEKTFQHLLDSFFEDFDAIFSKQLHHRLHVTIRESAEVAVAVREDDPT